MSTKVSRKKPHSKAACHVSPEEKAWLDDVLQQLAYDEYMQAHREHWLFPRPHKRVKEVDEKTVQYINSARRAYP